METLIVILIVVAAAAYVGRNVYRGFRKKGGCSCGCTGCGISESCGGPAEGNARDPISPKADR